MFTDQQFASDEVRKLFESLGQNGRRGTTGNISVTETRQKTTHQNDHRKKTKDRETHTNMGRRMFYRKQPLSPF